MASNKQTDTPAGVQEAPKDPGTTDQELEELRASVESETGPLDDTEPLMEMADELAEHPDKLAELTADDLSELATLGFDMLAARRGPHWKLAPAEAGRIGKWTHKVAQKHGMEWLGRWMAEIMSVLFLGVAVSVRLRQDREIAAGERGEEVTDHA